jgi:hypothetical protein
MRGDLVACVPRNRCTKKAIVVCVGVLCVAETMLAFIEEQARLICIYGSDVGGLELYKTMSICNAG